MTVQKTTHLPISIGQAAKRDIRTQFAALCYRIVKDKPQVLLITSRDTGRWIIPKGWPMEGVSPAKAAAQEAWEEAGAEGRTHDLVLGVYSYDKIMPNEAALPCVVAVFPLRVKRLAANYPEKGQRKRKWHSLKKAAARVNEAELAQIIAGFDPHRLRW
ncbi:8-oxo-dGTP pyrophosphatase MutT (NUDIX family) [Confluentimicrobium naphthalenivorans]|uniref:8-oxo-dGTP pyrophosphatase MutT (NUDIX family) n=1 Tax=Actibacterium naphthalenivorans TaxID=1614693 RepID=A0A840C484_9RHOB|nr:NUDIX hydrolase [Actibacterium sp. EMB200-NS6]MBB4020544.1 8-oxo-dGTP pyrophosphatase MutT (NUDIX family) [Actibacterium naphthalenivorans]